MPPQTCYTVGDKQFQEISKLNKPWDGKGDGNTGGDLKVAQEEVGPVLLGRQRGNAESADLAAAGGNHQVWSKQNNQHPISCFGVASSSFPSFPPPPLPPQMNSYFRKHNYDLQAFTIHLLEENLGSTFGNLSVAPAPSLQGTSSVRT